MICACAGSEMGRGGFVCVWQWLWVGGCWVSEERQVRGRVWLAWRTIAREQYVGQGLALANLSWLEPWLGVLNFCMHDQWQWIKKREREEKDSSVGEGKEQVGATWKDIERLKGKKFWFYLNCCDIEACCFSKRLLFKDKKYNERTVGKQIFVAWETLTKLFYGLKQQLWQILVCVKAKFAQLCVWVYVPG